MLDVKDDCTGCGCCAVICPTKSISMEQNKEGFRFPKINTSECIQCNLCNKNCPILNDMIFSKNTSAVAAQNTDITTRLNSSSGGVFSALAEKVLTKNGAVCAAKYDTDFSVIHTITENVEEVSKFRGAKYTQSKTEHCFYEIKQILEENRPVLFVGTPCQVAGLLSYLKGNYTNLFLVDMICHGVPSPMVWKMYLKERRSLDAGGADIKSVNLRNKSTGWSKYAYSVEILYQNSICYSVPQNQDYFMKGFVSNLYLRKSCSKCKFKGVERCSDLSLGDYWGIWEQYPDFDDNNGTSLILIHTEKGKELWKSVEGSFFTMNVSVENAIQYNPSAVEKSKTNIEREYFFKGLENGNTVTDMIKKILFKEENKKDSFLRKISNYFIRK